MELSPLGGPRAPPSVKPTFVQCLQWVESGRSPERLPAAAPAQIVKEAVSDRELLAQQSPMRRPFIDTLIRTPCPLPLAFTFMLACIVSGVKLPVMVI
jgi:hypothetical protein